MYRRKYRGPLKTHQQMPLTHISFFDEMNLDLSKVGNSIFAFDSLKQMGARQWAYKNRRVAKIRLGGDYILNMKSIGKRDGGVYKWRWSGFVTQLEHDRGIMTKVIRNVLERIIDDENPYVKDLAIRNPVFCRSYTYGFYLIGFDLRE